MRLTRNSPGVLGLGWKAHLFRVWGVWWGGTGLKFGRESKMAAKKNRKKHLWGPGRRARGPFGAASGALGRRGHGAWFRI